MIMTIIIIIIIKIIIMYLCYEYSQTWCMKTPCIGKEKMPLITGLSYVEMISILTIFMKAE
jgi:hypothetical protein